MFNETERMKLWRINEQCAGAVEEGADDNPYIPTMEALQEMAMNALRDAGFSAEYAKRSNANCIIRVYRHSGMPLPGWERATWMYGFETYIQNFGYFRCEPVGKKFDYTCQEVILYGKGGKRTKVQLYNSCFCDYFLTVSNC